MTSYYPIYIMILLFFIPILFNNYLRYWMKGIFIAYYIVLTYIFVTGKTNIDASYENILPVPTTYWDKNSAFVDTMMGYFWLPLIILVLFLYYKVFTKAKTVFIKLLIILSIIPIIFLFYGFAFIFSMMYGYRP